MNQLIVYLFINVYVNLLIKQFNFKLLNGTPEINL